MEGDCHPTLAVKKRDLELQLRIEYRNSEALAT
jgi:hypothetical protein